MTQLSKSIWIHIFQVICHHYLALHPTAMVCVPSGITCLFFCVIACLCRVIVMLGLFRQMLTRILCINMNIKND